MSTPLSFAPIIIAAGSRRGGLIATSQISSLARRNPYSLAICSDCLRNISSPFTQSRGKKTLPKATGVKVRLLKDIPEYGPKGSIMMVARGRMRTIWYQRGEAEYLTREIEKSIGKYSLVERDPSFRPVAKRVEDPSVYNPMAEYVPTGVRDKLLSNAETVNILSATLPPHIRFSRATTTPDSQDLHGSVSTADISGAIKMIVNASNHPDAGRVVITPENIKFVQVPGSTRVKQLGIWQIDIEFRGETAITREVIVMRDEDEESGPISGPAKTSGDQKAPGTIFSGGSATEPRQIL